MRLTVMIVDESIEKYKSEKRGEVESKRLVCLDADPNSGEILKNTFDYELSDDEAQHFGKLRMKTLQIGINEFTPGFGGRLRARGRIVPESLAKALGAK